ncbi:unnamed protein product [Aphanomyces euteiches]
MKREKLSANLLIFNIASASNMVSTSSPSNHLEFHVLPFDINTVSSALDAVSSTYLVVPSRDKSYRWILEYVADHLEAKHIRQSFEVDTGQK